MDDFTGSNLFNIENGGEEIYKDLFDHAHDLIYFARLDGILQLVNNAWVSVLKYSKRELVQKSLYDLVVDEDKERFLNYRSNVLKQQIVHEQITIRLKTKGDEVIFVEGSISLKLKEGKPAFIRGIFRDVTKRIVYEEELKAINKQLKQEEDNLQLLIANAPDAVIVIDQESKITLWNPKAEQLFGWSAKEVLHSPLADKIIPAQYREAHERGIKHFLKTGEGPVLNKTIEITAINKTRQEFYISLTISSFKINNQMAFISFIRDITVEKANQIELEQKTRELERSNSNLEEFAFAASHDLKEPVRKISFFSNQLKQSLSFHLNDKQTQIFDRIEQSTARMNCLLTTY